MSLQRLTVFLLGTVLLLPTFITAAPFAAAATTQTIDLLEDLHVASENPSGYSRDLFRHWIDADKDGCDTRQEVLKLESLTPVQTGAKCKIISGQWYSWFDDETVTDPSTLDIDHVVPLAEAWRSGARNWTSQQREEFANDLEYEWSLKAVTASANRSKGDRDPANWLPPNRALHCQYVTAWIGIKYRWRLTIDPAERSALASLTDGDCGQNAVDTPTRAIPASTAPEPSEPSPIASFPDVRKNHAFHKEVTWLANNEITTGYSDGTYRPRTQISREAMAAFMYRLADRESHASIQFFTPPARSPFPDVPRSHTFYKEITWLASTGITTGYDDGTFRPTTRISREAMGAFMYRYASLTSRPTRGMVGPEQMVFDDIVPKHAFHQEVTWMGVSGISTGYASKGCSNYRPNGKVTREAMAAFMYRLASGEGTRITTGCVTPPRNPGDIKNCSDFNNWKAANAWFQRYYKWYGDVARLDGDNDGIPCQSLPGAPRR